jgi:hypothetical protein
VSKGYCAPYNGQVCRQYLVGRGLVWFNVSQDNSGGWLNEQVPILRISAPGLPYFSWHNIPKREIFPK